MHHILGFIGSTLDRGLAERRWKRWRPTVSLCQQPDFPVGRLDLLYQRSYQELALQVAQDCKQCSPQTEVQLFELALPDPWDFEAVYAELEDFALAHPLPESGLVHITTGSHVSQICLFLLAESRILPPRLVQTFPARDEDSSLGRYALIDLDLSRYDRLSARLSARAASGRSLLTGGIETRNLRVIRLISEVEKVALTRAPILLTGPTGAGKTWLARRIDALKRERQRISGAFVEVNCATLRGGTAMSALFGHLKGAYTGALGDRAGFLKSADGGVLFLDEVGELGAEEQAQLLRAIEERRFFPVGGDKEVKSDFQLVCGTNRDLKAEVRAGRFREDLLARIEVWHFKLPGLKEREEDIGVLLQAELGARSKELGRRISISREALSGYLAFARSPEALWTGNFRDLAASVLRMATLAPGGRIDIGVVEAELERLRLRWAGVQEDVLEGVVSEEVRAGLDRFDRVQLEEVLRVCRGTRSLSEAGRVLFAVSREKKASSNDADRLKKYLGRFGVDFETAKGAEAQRAQRG